jgi:hypothetical protein
MNEYLKIPRPINPSCKLPDDIDSPAWRYMDMYKFESLLREQALYLRRGDLLQDRFEGTYSRNQILKMNQWFEKIKETHMIENEKARRSKDRSKSYISCWCLGKCDFDLMWKAYIEKPPGIAIRSSVRWLQMICNNAVTHWPLDISLVNYFDHSAGENINYLGTPAVFLNKDYHFRLDNELRIVHWPNMSEPTPDHVLLPVKLIDLIEFVILNPKSDENFLKVVRRLLDDSDCKEIPILYSRDDRELLE